MITGYVALLCTATNRPGQGRAKICGPGGCGRFNKTHFWSTSAGAADFDGDGYPDLYLCQYVNWSLVNDPECPGYTTTVKRDVCPPKKFEAVSHALWKNNGDGTFTDVSQAAGIRVNRPDKEHGKGLGVVCVDVNNDGKPDIYVANDTVDNFLYINKSSKGKPLFEEQALELGVARTTGACPMVRWGLMPPITMGGHASIWVTNYEGELHALYGNVFDKGRRFFQFRTQRSGIAAIGQLYVGFGTVFSDLDNDGWEDIFVSNGHVIYHPHQSQGSTKSDPFAQSWDGKFQEVAETSGSYFKGEHLGRGLVCGDLDNDGWPDLAICHANENMAILHNNTKSLAANRNWIGLELKGKNHADIVGAGCRWSTRQNPDPFLPRVEVATFPPPIVASILAWRILRTG